MESSDFLTLLAALFCCAFALTGCGGNSEEDTVKRFYTAVANGDSDSIVAMLDTSNLDEQELALAMRKFQMVSGEMKRSLEQKGGLKSVNDLDKTFSADGNQVTLTVKITLGNGESSTTEMTLVKINGEWKIHAN